MIYAREGDVICCARGCKLARVRRDLLRGEIVRLADQVELLRDDVTAGMKFCPACGARAAWGSNHPLLQTGNFWLHDPGPPPVVRPHPPQRAA